MRFNRKLVTLLMVIALTITMSMPMVYAPARRTENFGDPVGNLIDEDDPTLYGPATSMTVAIDKVKDLEEDLGIEIGDKASLPPKDQAKLDKAIARANDAVVRFIEKAGLTGDKASSTDNELEAFTYLSSTLEWLNN